MPDQPSFDEINDLLEALQADRADWDERLAGGPPPDEEGEEEWLTALNKSLADPNDPELEDAAWAAWVAHRKRRSP